MLFEEQLIVIASFFIAKFGYIYSENSFGRMLGSPYLQYNASPFESLVQRLLRAVREECFFFFFKSSGERKYKEPSLLVLCNDTLQTLLKE